MDVAVPRAPIGLLVEVVNTWAEAVCHDPAPAGGRQHPPLQQLLDAYGLRLHRPVATTRITRLADAYYRVFATPGRRRLAIANDLIGAAHLSPELSGTSVVWRASSELDGMLAGALLAHASVDPALTRLGTCSAERCRDAFVDTSQAGTRQFCTVRCQTRIKARRRRTSGA